MTADHSITLNKPVICVVGPTASGKTALAQSLAEVFDGEVVSADSMQVYRGMDIGTGKLPLAQRRVVHHGFDLVDPGEPYSAALFQEYARTMFSAIDDRGKRTVLAGGTGFYVRAAIDAYDFPAGEQTDNPVREHYNALAASEGPLAVWNILEQKDPASAGIIPPADIKRVVRALELLDTGTTYAEQKSRLSSLAQAVPARFIGLAVDPTLLNERINARVDAMIEEGLVEEVKCLLRAGFRDGITAPQAIGYKEIVAALEGAITLPEAVEAIKLATRRYAKRQRTWFRKDERISWICADSPDIDALTEQACEALARMSEQ